MNGTPHPYRLELIDRWRAFLEGRATEAETGQYVDLRLADYGPEELVHDGALLLSEDLRGGIRGHSEAVSSSDRLEGWKREAAMFDADPDRWNRDWAIGYLERVLPGIKPARRLRVIQAMSEKLKPGDAAEIAGRFETA